MGGRGEAEIKSILWWRNTGRKVTATKKTQGGRGGPITIMKKKKGTKN